MISRFLALVLLVGLSTSLQVFAKSVWTEKPANSPALVQLPSIQPIVREVDTAVVFINSTSKGGAAKQDGEEGKPRRRGPMRPEDLFEKFFEQQQPQQPRRSSGSGFIISKDGYILTNNHVIDNADKIEVTITRVDDKNHKSSKQDSFSAEVVGRDPRTDIAIIKIKPTFDLQVAPLGDSDVLLKGDWVVALGNPFGLEHSVSVGIVSAKEREISPNENRRFDDFIQTDAAINFGNSGGPLVNLKGEVIGINTAITAQGSGIGFAIPINMVKALLPQLMEKGGVSRGYLGVTIQDVTPEVKDAMGLDVSDGVLINGVAPDGPAAKSDVKSGDVIIQVNDAKTPDAKALQRVIGSLPPGNTVTLTVMRDKKQRTVKIKLGALDQPITKGGEKENADADILGMVVGQNTQGQGIMVLDLDEDSPAAMNGVRPRDVLLQLSHQGKKVNLTSVKEYQDAVAKLKEGDSVVLQIERSDGDNSIRSYIPFRVPAKTKRN